MVISTRTKGSCPCTDYKRRKSLCRYFSLQLWCTVYTVLYRKTSHVVLSRTKHPWRILLAILDTFSRLRPLWFLDLSGLFSPEEKTTKRPVVFIDVRGAKNEDRLTSLSMLRNLEMCPSSSCFLSRLSWCSSVSSF